jgi:hypothetical protein
MLVMDRIVRIALELALRTFLIILTVIFLQGVLLDFFDVQVPLLIWVALAAAISVPMTVGLYNRAAEPGFDPTRKLTRKQALRRWAFALWSTPVLLYPIWLFFLLDPTLILEFWDLFLLFYGLPFAAAAALYFFAGRVGSSPPNNYSA